MSADPAETAQLLADLSDAMGAGEDYRALDQLGRLTDALLEAIVDDEVSVQEVLHAGLNRAATLTYNRAGNTPSGFRLLGMIEGVSWMADTAIRTHRFHALSSAGPQALALKVLKEIAGSPGPLSDSAITHAFGVRRMDLRPTLDHLQNSGLIKVSQSHESSLYGVTRQGLRALRDSHVPHIPTAMDGLALDDEETSPSMRR